MIAKRIQINGSWYILEDSVSSPSEQHINPELVSFSESITYENEEYVLEAHRLVEYPESPWIMIKSKLNTDVCEIDNPTFMRGLLNSNSESLEEIEEEFYFKDIHLVKEFLEILQTNNWI